MSDSSNIPPGSRALYVDLERCIGCNACALACKQENNVAIGSLWTRNYGAEKGDYPSVNVQVLPMHCQQCINAPCKAKCDSLGYKAIIRRPDGILYVDSVLCMGCQQCIPVCPFKVLNFNTQTNKAEKCHYCMHRIDKGLLPACVITCLGITLEFGYYEDLRARHPEAKNMGGPKSFTGEEITPKVLYDNLGDEPKRPTNGYPNPVPCHHDD